MNQKILEVLIPTYKRPKSAIGAIESVLSHKNPTVGVFCHSNGFELELQTAKQNNKYLRYEYFPDNRGATANFKRIIEESSAKYVLLLSDEDRINPEYLNEFIQYIEDGTYSFVMCSIGDHTGSNYFSLSSFNKNTLTHEDLITLFAMSPTYLSGYCFRKDIISKKLLSTAFENNKSNVYPHLILRNAIPRNSKTGIFGKNLIIKGPEAKIGGDSHAHTNTIEPLKLREKTLLNPSIYGRNARAAQFEYLLPKFHQQLNHLPKYLYIFSILYFLGAWLKIYIDADLYAENNDSAISLTKPSTSDNLLHLRYLFIFNRIINIKNTKLRNGIVRLFWETSRAFRFLLFAKRFGLRSTLNFIGQKSR